MAGATEDNPLGLTKPLTPADAICAFLRWGAGWKLVLSTTFFVDIETGERRRITIGGQVPPADLRKP